MMLTLVKFAWVTVAAPVVGMAVVLVEFDVSVRMAASMVTTAFCTWVWTFSTALYQDCCVNEELYCCSREV